MKFKVFLNTEKFNEIFIRSNKSQNSFAHKLEISSGYMSQLMEGTKHPSPKLREKIINALPGCNFDDLFFIEKVNN